MAQVGGVPRKRKSQVGGVPRKRKSQDSNLKQEVKKSKQHLLIIAPLGIVGAAGTGRKTLAYRFGNMDVGVFEEQIPVAYRYIVVWHIRRQNEKYSGCTVKLTIYIIEEPVELTPNPYPLYMREWDRFCCLVFVYDIQNTTTSVGYLMTALENFRIKNLRIPVMFLVGNKHDEELQQPPNQNEEEAENQGRRRFLCSAKRNIGVRPLFNEIIHLAFKREYMFP